MVSYIYIHGNKQINKHWALEGGGGLQTPARVVLNVFPSASLRFALIAWLDELHPGSPSNSTAASLLPSIARSNKNNYAPSPRSAAADGAVRPTSKSCTSLDFDSESGRTDNFLNDANDNIDTHKDGSVSSMRARALGLDSVSGVGSSKNLFGAQTLFAGSSQDQDKTFHRFGIIVPRASRQRTRRLARALFSRGACNPRNRARHILLRNLTAPAGIYFSLPMGKCNIKVSPAMIQVL